MSSETLIAEVLEKMIDSQIANTEALTSLRFALSDTSTELKELRSFFSNGFRGDIREILKTSEQNNQHVNEIYVKISEDIDAHNNECQKGKDEIIREVSSFKSIGFWIKIICGAIVSLGAIAVLLIKLTNTG